MKKIINLVPLIFFVALFLMPGYIFSSPWQSLGNVYGSYVFSIYGSSKNIIYLGGGGYLKYSIDNGLSWLEVDEPRNRKPAFCYKMR